MDQELTTYIEKLKSCPFCGEAATMEKSGRWLRELCGVRVYCTNFSVQGHERLNPCPMAFWSQAFDTPEKAIAAWNSRVS